MWLEQRQWHIESPHPFANGYFVYCFPSKSFKMKPFLLLFLFITLSCSAQNTRSLSEGETSPPASLEEISWMEGHWKGQAFGGITEEVWSPPLGGSMMFAFKHVLNGKVNFYELGHIQEIDNTLLFQLKHFNGDLKGWEEKDEMVTAKLVKVAESKIYFEDFTFEKISDDEINIYVVVEEAGKSEEVKFNYKRVTK